MDRLAKSLAGWKPKLLSPDARLTLIKHVLMALPLYFMSVLELSLLHVSFGSPCLGDQRNREEMPGIPLERWSWGMDKMLYFGKIIGCRMVVQWKTEDLSSLSFVKNSGMTVAAALRNNSWVSDIRDGLSVQALGEYLDLWDVIAGISLDPASRDEMIWKAAPDGRMKCPLGKIIWKSRAPARCKFFMFLAMRNACLTADNLQRRGLSLARIYYMCSLKQQTMVALFRFLTYMLYAISFGEFGKKLRDRLCLSFFPDTRITTLRVEIISFQQIKNESIGAAWSRFTNLLQSGPTLSLPEYMLLQHFHMGLDKESTFYLNITAGGSFMHKTPLEGKIILDRILESTSFMAQSDEPPPEVSVSKIEEPSTIESQSEPSTSTGSIDEKVPLQPSVANEEIQTSDHAAILLRDGFDEDYGNTLNYFSKKKPLVPLPPPDLMELGFLRETVRELTSIMSDEWLREAELSYEGNDIGILYSPTIEVNLIFESFAFAYLSDKPVTLTNKFFKHPNGNIIEGFGIVQDVPVYFEDREAVLDFHVFEIRDIVILIGLSIEQLLINTLRLDSLKITLGGNEFSVPFSRARFALTDSLSEIELAEEIWEEEGKEKKGKEGSGGNRGCYVKYRSKISLRSVFFSGILASQAYVVFLGVTVTAVPPHESPEPLLEDEVVARYEIVNKGCYDLDPSLT
uniref:Retroelement n=2 Tax=Oryza sativa subsp. japonica TaxID=39947 RepID=A0A5S6R7S1_ORYSJ|nr:Putative retroelement [Oryza sativa Japonica Group]AAN04202.1 Putative retroelement [Oryza sativa Japonica Group]ABB46801.2 hypothetical protein LOC_Os10g07160 [Oryza sativa Japonica Group]